MSLRTQFFSKTFREGLTIAVILYVLGFLAYQYNMAQGMLLGFMPAMAFVAYQRPERALMLVFLELFINPHGALISADINGFALSLRMAIFIGVMAGWGTRVIKDRTRPKTNKLAIFAPLALAVAFGGIMGVFSGNPSQAFADGNAYMYLLYLLPIATINWTPDRRGALLQTLAAGAIFVSTLSIGLLYVFSHLDASLLTTTYAFFRDLRIAEITALNSGAYRVFIQSQFFVVVFGLMIFALIGRKIDPRWLAGLAGLTYAILFLSLSRSFWVGTLPAVIFLLWVLWRDLKPRVRTIVVFIGWTTLTKLLAIAAIAAIILIPLPPQQLSGGDLVSSLKDRATEEGAAVSSRWKLVMPMMDTILDRPLVGSGFGTTVTFTTDDPRAREAQPDGIWTTYAMEWGWLELWIKMGILGPIAFLYMGWELTRRLWAYRSTDQAWLGYSLIASLIFLYATHGFSPYLNHPIGLGMLLFVFIFLPNNKTAEAQVEEYAPDIPRKAVPQAVSVSNQTS